MRVFYVTERRGDPSAALSRTDVAKFFRRSDADQHIAALPAGRSLFEVEEREEAEQLQHLTHRLGPQR